jgi:5'-deoxynucleotidase YfbR-like HD superfamily hydrolase
MSKKFPPASAALSRHVAEMLKIVRKINIFRTRKRLIWYKGPASGSLEDDRELVGEHSEQLAMFAWYVQQRHLPHLDLLKVLQYAHVHDWPEIYAEDTPAFPDKSGAFDAKYDPGTKKEREQKAVERLKREIGGTFWPMFECLEAYESQQDEESRFVYALDKFLSDLNIYEDGGRTNMMLRVTLEEQMAYKRPRVAAHPKILEFYDEFCRFCAAYRHDVHFEPKETADAS